MPVPPSAQGVGVVEAFGHGMKSYSDMYGALKCSLRMFK